MRFPGLNWRVERFGGVITLILVTVAALPMARAVASSEFTGGGEVQATDSPSGIAFFDGTCYEQHDVQGDFAGSVIVGDDEVVRVESEFFWTSTSDACEGSSWAAPHDGDVDTFGITPGAAGDFSVSEGGGSFSQDGTALIMDLSGLCRHDSREDHCLLHFQGVWVPADFINESQYITGARVVGSLTIFCIGEETSSC